MKKEICIVYIISILAGITTAENTDIVNLTECEKLKGLLLNQKLIDSVMVLIRKSFCGSDDKNACCYLRDNTIQGTDEPTQSRVKEGTGKGGEEPNEIIDPSNPLLLSVLPSNRTCGKITINNKNGQYPGDGPVKLGQRPWTVAIGYKSSDQNSTDIYWGCSGTLITKRHVLTAAHCLVNLGDLAPTVARLGDLDLNPDVRDGTKPRDVLIDSVIIHEKYSNDIKQINDIALLILKDNVTFNNCIKPICLPGTLDVNDNETTVIVSGWSSNNPSQMFDQIFPPLKTKLMDVELPLLHNDECKTTYADTESIVIDDKVSCAGFLESKNESCQGSSGSPLMSKNGSQYYVKGVVSYVPSEYGITDRPVVYTRVPFFIDWILGKIIQSSTL